MVRIIIDIDERGDTFATKEAVAYALEHFGNIRIVKIIRGDSR